jgi:hypothetical protein
MLVGGNGGVCGGFEREENRYFISLPRRFAIEDLGETNGPTCFSYCRPFLSVYIYMYPYLQRPRSFVTMLLSILLLEVSKIENHPRKLPPLQESTFSSALPLVIYHTIMR